MKLQPIVYTTAMDRATEWYSAVLGISPSYQSDVWTSFAVEGGHLALHRVERLPEESKVALSFVVTDPLESLVERLGSSNITLERGIQEETFGRSLVVKDPDGTHIQVNEH